ncbi:MAG TPA: PilZ domain-containing protein [Nitrospira sp.]|nr:PilZ domain-containing protein [Nitrospira sp.]
MMSLLEFVSLCGVASLTAAGASEGFRRLRRSRVEHFEDRVHVPLEEPLGRPAPGTWHEPRDRKRHPVSWRIEYIVEDVRHEGTLIDMSLHGWRAHGVHPVAKGTMMCVEILDLDPRQRIRIDQAVVRWTDGQEFGVEVTQISPAAAAALSEYLTMLFPPAAPLPVYALSPFSYN